MNRNSSNLSGTLCGSSDSDYPIELIYENGEGSRLSVNIFSYFSTLHTDFDLLFIDNKKNFLRPAFRNNKKTLSKK